MCTEDVPRAHSVLQTHCPSALRQTVENPQSQLLLCRLVLPIQASAQIFNSLHYRIGSIIFLYKVLLSFRSQIHSPDLPLLWLIPPPSPRATFSAVEMVCRPGGLVPHLANHSPAFLFTSRALWHLVDELTPFRYFTCTHHSHNTSLERTVYLIYHAKNWAL